MIVKQQLAEYARLIEAALDKFLPDSSMPQKRVVDAARYSLLGGGKRLRPALLLEFYRLCGGRADEALPFACALEMIHTYSLIHDDLPCMDDDDLRRGRATCHKAFDEWTAVLAGDALLNRAYEVMSDAAIDFPRPQDAVRAMNHIAHCAGLYGMVGGQTMDLQMEAGRLGADNLEQMVLLKTGALLSAACVGGCLLAGASQEQCQAAEQYARSFGLAFQIRDDVLDAEGNEQELGKTIGSDEKDGKTTYLTVFGPEECRRRIDALTQEALQAAQSFPDSAFLCELAWWLADRTS